MNLRIDEKTSIPLGLAITCIGLAAIWMATTSFQVSANTRINEDQEKKLAEYVRNQQAIMVELAVIQTKIESVKKSLGE